MFLDLLDICKSSPSLLTKQKSRSSKNFLPSSHQIMTLPSPLVHPGRISRYVCVCVWWLSWFRVSSDEEKDEKIPGILPVWLASTYPDSLLDFFLLQKHW